MTEEVNSKTGLPMLDEAEKAKNAKGAVAAGIVLNLVFTAVGGGIAWAVTKWGSTSAYDAKITTLRTIDPNFMYAYLACVVFAYVVVFLNFYPVFYKEQVMRGGNLRANQFIFRLAAENADESSAVVLHEDGDLGLYNRANRGIYHFLENCLPLVVSLPLGFWTYPFPTFVCVCVYSFGRVVYQIGYTLGGFGLHLPGFMCDRGATFTMIGLLAFAAYKF